MRSKTEDDLTVLMAVQIEAVDIRIESSPPWMEISYVWATDRQVRNGLVLGIRIALDEFGHATYQVVDFSASTLGAYRHEPHDLVQDLQERFSANRTALWHAACAARTAEAAGVAA